MAAFRAGLLPARKAARITAHLSSCPRCAEIDAQLAAVTTILASTPAPPLPAALAARLDAALAAEVAARAASAASPAAGPSAAAASPAGPSPAGPSPAGPSPAGPSPAGPARPGGAAGQRAGRSRAPWRLSPRFAAVTAAVVALLAGGGYAVAQLVTAGSSGVSASLPGTAPPHSAAGQQSGAAGAPEAAPRAPTSAGLPLVASGTEYRAGQLPAQVAAVLRRYPAPGSSAGHVTAPPPAAARAFPQLRACVSYLAGGQRPRLVDIARYGTRPAAVIVVPVTGTATVRVWVVGTGCSGQGGGVISRFAMPAPG
jgi:hypothetical protein